MDKAEKTADDQKPKDDQNKLWAKQPKKEITRVFAAMKPPATEVVVTLHASTKTVDGVIEKTPAQRIRPNGASQYVLLEGAPEYQKQLDVLRRRAKRGVIFERDPECLGIPWIPPEMVEYQKKKAQLAALEKELKAKQLLD